MTSCNGETSNQSNQKVNYEKAMSQALSEIFQNLKEIKQDTKRQRDKLLLERRRGSAPSSVLRKTTTTLQLPKNEISKSTSNMLWVLQCEEEDASWMTDWWNLAQTLNSPTLWNLTFNYSYRTKMYLSWWKPRKINYCVATQSDQCNTYLWKTLAELLELKLITN